MPVLSLACHLPHNTPHIPSRYNNEQTTKQTKAINNSYIYINISCKCDTNRAGHFTLDAYASRPVACRWFWNGTYLGYAGTSGIMMTSPNENISRITGPSRESTGGFSSQRPVTGSFDALFDLRLDNQLSKQSRWLIETPLRSLWRHCNWRTWHLYASTVRVIENCWILLLRLLPEVYLWTSENYANYTKFIPAHQILSTNQPNHTKRKQHSGYHT